MNYKRLNYIVGAFVLLISALTYWTTMQPTLSFWDCGEFAACAYSLSVPHPPGAPLWTVIGKVAMMMPFGSNPAVRLNAISALSTAFTSFFLYLVIVIVIKNWRGSIKNNWDAVMVFGAGLIGALSYTFSDAVWFNSLESEVYAFGTMFIGLCTWLIMLWWEHANEKHNEKYLLLVAFLVGLALGIHLLVVQVILVGGMIYYFRKYEYNRKTFLIAMGITSLCFIAVYPIIVLWFPTWLGGDLKTLSLTDSSLVRWFAILIVPGTIYGVYWAYNKGKHTLATAFAGLFLVILGYSIYAGVVLRARVDNLPINENQPKDINTLVKYLSREQYGDAPFWPRRYSQEPMHRRTWTNYTSDMDFMWRWQINHMFNRYLGWQYIGREGYMQDEGIDWSKLYGIPFLVGLFGLFYHFRKDWKLGLSFLWMFALMGILSALFQRQQDPQPRERDYFYVGAFFAYSLWIGLGVMGIMELIQDGLKNSAASKAIGGLAIAVLLVFIPGNMYKTNHFYQDRHNNYVPFDYAYNILQSVGQDGIVFTNGDNDTFPLWYIQTVEGVRTDVRVVNLSLLNTDWYIKEMKNSMPYGSKKVPISYTDAQIERLAPTQWTEYKMMSIPTPPESYPDSIKAKGNIPDKISFKMPATINQGNVKGVKVQDLMIYDIIKTNNWQRPVYFSATVTDDNYIGLDEYLVNEGMSKRLVPYKDTTPSQFRVNEKLMAENFMQTPQTVSKTYQPGFFWRGLNDKNIFFDQTHSNLVQNYRSQFLMFAYYFLEKDKARAGQILDRMEELLPRSVIPMDYRIQYDVAMLYMKIGNKDKFIALSSEIEKGALEELKRNPNDVQSFYNPYRILIDIYEAKEDYKSALDILQRLDRISPNSPEVKQKIEMYNQKLQGK